MHTYVEFVRDASLTRHKLMQQQRRACPDVQRVLSVDRTDSSEQCCASLLKATQIVDELPTDRRPFMVKVAAVEQRLGGRLGVYDMLYFPATRVTAAVDCKDDRFVGMVKLVPQIVEVTGEDDEE